MLEVFIGLIAYPYWTVANRAVALKSGQIIRGAFHERFFKRNSVHRLDVAVRGGDYVHNPAIIILEGAAGGENSSKRG